MLILRLVLLASFLFPLALPAQTVHGTLREEGSDLPLRGALVELRDAASTRQAAALTDANGRFAVTAPRPGRYTLRAELVGYGTATSPLLELGPGDAREVGLVLAPTPLALEGISGSGGRRRCRTHPESARETARLWEEARKGLNSAAWAEEASLYRFDITLYERDLNAGTLAVESERREQRRTRARRPFESRPVSSLMEGGFVQSTEEGTFYYAPDARVLLSEAFLEGHCYRITDGEEGQIGLAFEPVPGRRPVEIQGVLWLDRETAELRHLEYRYVNLPHAVGTERLGGRVEFARLPTGAWIVERWWVRMPAIRLEERVGHSVSGAPAERRQEERLLGIREAGGEVVATYTPDGVRVTDLARMAVEGRVLDETGAAPLAGATVFLSGTQFSATTDAAGRFRMEGVPPGEYTVSFFHPALEAAEHPPEPRSVSVQRDGAATVELLAPPVRVAARAAPPAAGERGDSLRPVPIAGVEVVGRTEFQRRAKRGSGFYITREEIEKEKPHRAVDLFRRIPAVEIVGGRSIRIRGSGASMPGGQFALPNSSTALPTGSAAVGGGDGRMQLCRSKALCDQEASNIQEEIRHQQADRPADCQPTFYLDGVAWEPIGGDLNSLRPEEIEGVEVYPRAATAPGEYKRLGSECGIILVWTRKTAGSR